MNTKVIVASLSVVLTFVTSPMVAEEPFYFLLTGERLSCLSRHAEDYARDLTEDTVFIAVDDCGKTNSGPISLLDQVINSAPDIDVSQDDQQDKIIALTRPDFSCLASLDIPNEATLVAFFPEKCSVEIRN